MALIEQPRPSAPVVFIGGFGRSGSTLLERMLGCLDGVVTLGEVGHLWQRGIVNDESCGCGQPFSRCPFWSEVGQRAFGGWASVDVARVLDLKDGVDRQRRMPSTARRRPPASVAERVSEYTEYYRAVYDAARSVAGASVVVDSTKETPTALALSHNPAVDLRVMHIVRDSRGVAHSWTKAVERPETGSSQLMPQWSVARSAGLWLSLNLAMSALPYRGVPLTRVQYERLVEDPVEVVATAWRSLELPGSGTLSMGDGNAIELGHTHSVAGNPMRFKHGMITLRADTAWHQDMSVRDKVVVTAMTFPLLTALGYPITGARSARTT